MHSAAVLPEMYRYAMKLLSRHIAQKFENQFHLVVIFIPAISKMVYNWEMTQW